MLVLRRKPEEALVINGTIAIYVLAVEGERVKLGIVAPPDVVVVREELLHAEHQQAEIRRKQEELARETNPRQREKLEAGIVRMQQALQFTQPARAPVSLETRQE